MRSGLGEPLKLSLIGALICLGLWVGGLAVFVHSRPGFNGWVNAYQDIVHNQGHGLDPDVSAVEFEP